MTADVNVTEKVARAEAKRREPLQWRESVEWRDGFVAGVLWHFERLADPEVLAGIAGVLYEADPLPGKPSWDGLRSESAQWPDGVARWAETRALERASALADWLRGQR